ncbi:MAG: DUF4346 domain-containing protein [Thermaerobacter sp.]|jgi:tetrahydromethanopterin S-methyltransferase subunit A|nr:DUF4346 domain-containing protein [Thermaerobacter sp.]
MTTSEEVQGKKITAAAITLHRAARTKKCRSCGCLHSSLDALERAFPPVSAPLELAAAMAYARANLAEIRYDCLGCRVCHPARALELLDLGLETCPAGEVAERAGWPPLPGAYAALRYQAPVAVCTLTDEVLAAAVADWAGPQVAIAGTIQTENLGIERLILNILANPHIRFLLLCGADSQGAVGHLPGQSLLALAQGGLNAYGRIIESRGKRPFLHNIAPAAVEHFRSTVETVDRIGIADLPAVAAAAVECAARYPGPAEPFQTSRRVEVLQGYEPQRMVPDPAGYFVVFMDRIRRLLTLEHYRNDGVLDAVIEGEKAAQLYWPAVERGLLSRLDHAAYLGRESARAEEALSTGEPYSQDASPGQA